MKNSILVVLVTAGFLISNVNSIFAQKKGEYENVNSFSSVLLSKPLDRKIKIKVKKTKTEYSVYLVHTLKAPNETHFVLDDGKITKGRIDSAFKDPKIELVIESVKLPTAVQTNVLKTLVEDGTIPAELVQKYQVSLSFGAVEVASSGETSLISEGEIKNLHDVIPRSATVGPRK